MKTPILFALISAASVLHGFGQTVDTVITNRLAEPYNVAVEANIYYLTDSANDRIIKFVPDTGAFTTLAGFAGRPGATDAKGVYARFYSPHGIVSVPARGGLVVSDYGNHTLRLVKLDGTVTTLAGTPGQAGFDATHFNFPSALATDATGNIYIADSKNNAIRKLDLANSITTVASGLNQPNGIALGDNGDLWIADSRDHTIKRLPPGGVPQLAAGLPGHSGALDSVFGNEALFSNPSALVWLGGSNGLLVCDTGNHALRQVYFDPEIGGYSVETFAGTLTQPGLVDGAVLQSKFNLPSGITKDPTGGFLIADLGNNSLRRIQTSPPQPPVRNPIIGYVAFVKDPFGELLSVIVPISQGVFNNDVIIAILPEPATETYYTFGDTPPSTLEDPIPSPNRLTGRTPPPYRDGLHASEVQASIPHSGIEDLTIKSMSVQDGRRPSSVVQARFQFKVANPIIQGENAASFYVTNITEQAEMWYTIDGSNPEPHGATSLRIIDGAPVQLGRIRAPLTFQVRAFRDSFKSSEVVITEFQPENFQANLISFGFEDGEASSRFIASAGQTFFAPVTLSTLPNQLVYTLQFAVTVTNILGSPPVSAAGVGFESMLKENITGDSYRTIPAAMFRGGQTVPPEITLPRGFADLRFTNSANNLLGVGWLERKGTNTLYDTIRQDLITYSIAHDTLFLSKNQRVVAGGYSFRLPANALPGQQFEIQIIRPSATSDGIGQDVLIETPVDGSRQGGAINSIKAVTVGETNYIVGDVAPFRWFNGGDFGDRLLLNNDVVQVFQTAIYHLDPPPAGSDFFDAMDSSDGTQSRIFFGDDTSINSITKGDHQLNVDDVYVTFRRSLDPSLYWFTRSWKNGQLVTTRVDNVFRASADVPGERRSALTASVPTGSVLPGTPAITLGIDDVQVQPGQTLQIPVRSRVTGEYPIRVLMLSLSVEALDGSEPVTEPVQFVPVAALGQPTMTSSRAAHNFAGAWLNSQVDGVIGAGIVGHLNVVIPTAAGPKAAYRIHFDHASASPNGLAIFPKQTEDGVLTLQNRSASSFGDGIPDSWRLRYFGSVSNLLAQAAADADGDGASNLDEFKAGTNPADSQSSLRVAAKTGSNQVVLRWPSMLNKNYVIETAPSLSSTEWFPLATGLVGTGDEMQFTPSTASEAAQFFRVRVSD